MRLRALPLCTAIFFAATSSSHAADWLQFRGPGGLGIALDKNLPTTWSATSNVVWKTPLPGPGASSAIVVGKKIFVTCYTGYADGKGAGDMKDLRLILVCLDRAGTILWQKAVPAALPEQPHQSYMANHGYASSTPVSDGKHVFVYYGKTGVFAFDLEGKQIWHESVGTNLHSWGSGSSPILYKDLIIVNAAVESGALIALKKKDGSRAWSAQGLEYSWNTPLLVNLPGGKQELAVGIPNQVLGFDPDKGTRLWHCEGIEDYICPSMVAHDGVVYAIGARQGAALAIRAGGKGDVSATNVRWRINKGSNVCSPVYHEGHLYWAHEERGIVYCVDAEKGTVVYEQRLTPNPDRIYASPVAADGKLYFVSRTQGTYVLDARPKFRLLAHNSLGDDSTFSGSPAIDGGQILLRSDRFLYCLAAR